MNLIFRMLRVFLTAFFRPQIDLMACSDLIFRVVPSDLDINLHMTNARYLSIMDLGRMDWLIRVGMLGLLKREHWRPVVGSIDIKFQRPLQAFQRFTLKSRLVCWDEKWLYMEQRLESGRGLHAVATVRGLFQGREGSVPSRVVLGRMGHHLDSPPFPAHVLCLLAWEEAGKKVRSKVKQVLTSAI